MCIFCVLDGIVENEVIIKKVTHAGCISIVLQVLFLAYFCICSIGRGLGVFLEFFYLKSELHKLIAMESHTFHPWFPMNHSASEPVMCSLGSYMYNVVTPPDLECACVCVCMLTAKLKASSYLCNEDSKEKEYFHILYMWYNHIYAKSVD